LHTLFTILLLGCRSPAPPSESLPSGEAVAPALIGTRPIQPVALPAFTARNSDGTTRTADAVRGHPTVVWFFPAAGTPG
jgi:hypothetical protein